MTKNDVIEKIKSYDIPTDFLNSIDGDLCNYVSANLTNTDDHNKYEILGVLRFLDFLKRDDLDFRIKEIKKFYAFYHSLKFESPKGMQHFELTPPQKFQTANIFGFYKKGTDYRLTRDALLFVPRKYAKTTLCSSFAIYDLLFGSPDAQSYIASNSFSQSQIMFNIIKHTLQSLDPQLRYFKLNRDIIYSKIKGRTSFIRCLSSSAMKLDGLNPETVCLDEYAESPTAELRNVLTSGEGARKNPLNVTLTTASTLLESPFTEMLENYKQVLEGKINADSVFASIFMPDEEDTDLGDPKVWKKCNPHIGITIDENYYPIEWEKAQLSANDLTNFKTKLLNVFCKAESEVWINPSIIRRNTIDINIDKLKSKPMAMIAVDLSVKDDLSAVSLGLYSSLNHIFYFKNWYYAPMNTIKTSANKEFYKQAVEEYNLIPCGSEIIDYRQIANDIIALAKKVTLLQVNFDAFKSREMINILKASGIICKPFSQTYSHFTSPVDSFQIGLYNDKIKLDDNPLIAWNIGNAIIDVDRMENKKPIKRTANEKVDGIQCILMNLGAFQEYHRRPTLKISKIK